MDNQTTETPDEEINEGDTPAPDAMQQPADDTSGKNVVTVPLDMLPPGAQLKEGDKLTFCITGTPDQDGATGYFEPPAPEGEDADWDEEFKKSMSAREPQSDDQPM